MSKKDIDIADIGFVSVYKQKRSKSIRLRITREGNIRVTIPVWMPYRAAVSFVESKKTWISENITTKPAISVGDLIGKSHIVVVSYKASQATPSARLSDETISLSLPFSAKVEDESVQEILQEYSVRALRQEAKQVLPLRLRELANQHDFTYGNVSIKKMSSRWGSCTQKKAISLNLFLMQLDDDLIDYVLLHELLHTKIHRHGAVFWNELNRYVPDVESVRKRMRDKQTYVIPERLRT